MRWFLYTRAKLDMTRCIRQFLALAVSTWLVACGTDSGSGNGQAGDDASTPVVVSGSGGSGIESGVTMRLTDAPIDGLTNVVIQFTAVELRMTSGGWIRYDLVTPLSTDLLQLQGASTEDLLLNVNASTGDYNELRLFTGSGSMANYVVETAGGTEPLQIPGGSVSGLKIQQNFTITEGQTGNFVIDINLRQSVVSPGNSGNYQFKPVIRLVPTAGTGTVSGTVDTTMLTAASCSDGQASTFNAAYVFSGHNVTPDDINQSGSNTEPFETTGIIYDTTMSSYTYTAAFLPAGDYTIALTCNGDLEDLDADDNLQFFNTQNVTVLANNTIFL